MDTGGRLAGLALAWLAGVALQLRQAELQAPLLYLTALAAGAAGLLLATALGWRRAPLAAWLAAALLGFGAAGWQAGARLGEALPAALEGQDLVLDGVVASLPQRGATGLRFRFEVESARHRGAPVPVPRLLALGWWRGFEEEASLLDPRGELRAGQRWRVTVRLRQPHGNLNPHGFDYELYLFEQGVRATGYVRATREAPAQRLDEAAGYPLQRWRQRVRDAIDGHVDDARAAGVLAALAVGDQAAIERADWDLFRNTGVAHLMSISGLHVTMFAWLAGLGLGALWRRSARLMFWLPAAQAARWGGLAAALGYALFSGWGVPSQRTVWMLATVTLLQALGRRWPFALVLLAAAVVVTALDPWALLQPGFWLSFTAVGLLMASDGAAPRPQPSGALAVGWRRWARRAGQALRGGLRTQVIATAGLTPLSLVFFQQVSLVGLAANLLAIPLVTLVITPLALLGALAPPLWSVAAWTVQLLGLALGGLGALPGAVWQGAAAPVWAQLAGLAAALVLVAPLPWRLRLLAPALALPLFLPPRSLPVPGSFELLAADVGQGTAVLVRTRAHLLLYDAGPRYSLDSDAGQRVLLPLLRARGETRVDRLLLSHRDTDHVGGADTLLRSLPVPELLSSLEPGHALQAAGASASRCEAGQRWDWDGVHFELLGPPAGDYARGLKPNALSCVLRVSAGGRSALLAGDIERAQEAALVAAHGAALRSELLLVPHHGSRSSSSEAWLDAVQPRVAVFQAGYRNRFGHPAPEVLARYRERGIATVQTAACGAWTWREDSARCEREAARRYWQHRTDGS